MFARVASRFLNVFAFFSILFVSLVAAGRVPNASDTCTDLAMLFARGSSSNAEHLYLDDPFGSNFETEEQIPGAFFRWMDLRLKADYPHINYKAISIHNSGNMWSANGYPAVGIFNATTINNAFDAELSWWPAGEYRGSVRSGMDELKGQINYEAMRCPNQRIVVGGYSQGAHVVGEALFEVPPSQRNLIDNVVLFGDPKFIGAEYNKYNPLSKPKAYPWHRGTAGLKESGINDARVPYVPDDMKYKTISWCHEDDFICSGYSGLAWGVATHGMPSNDHSIWNGAKGALGDGHTRYPVFGVPEATEEVLANLKHHLGALEISRGGLDPNATSYKKAYDGTLKNNHPVDLMFALNNTGGIEDAHAQYFQKLKGILTQYKNNFPNMQKGSVLYTDMAGGSGQNQSPVAGYTQKPNNLKPGSENIYNSDLYIWGIGGGGDYPENHGMAIERAGMLASWRSDARKHIVLFAERPAHEAYSFNMCHSSIISALPHAGETPCVEGKEFSTTTHPEWCFNVYHTLADQACPYIGPTATQKVINRTLEDAVMIARSQGFVVDIIQPHTARNNQQNYPPAYVSGQLKNLAESTGGLYLKYDVFGEPEMRDAIWRILNHEPNLMHASGYAPGSLLDLQSSDIDTGLFDGIARIPIQTTTLLSTTPVSGAQSYGWDFDSDGVIDELTDGPSVEALLGVSQEKFLVVKAYSSPTGTGQLSSAVVPIQTTSPIESIYLPTVTDGLSGLYAKQYENESVVSIGWNVDGLGELDIVFVFDPVSGVPIGSVPAMNGGYVLSPGVDFGGQVAVQLVRPGAEANRQLATVEVVEAPDENEPEEQPGEAQNNEEETDMPDEQEQPVNEEPKPTNGDTDDVGQTDDKVVAQNEPNTSANTPMQATETLPAITSTSTPSTSIQAASASTPQTTLVRAAQDTGNPQDEVGDINDVKKLFPEIASSPPASGEESSTNWLLIALGGGGAVFLLGLVFVLWRRSSDDSKKEPATK